MHASMEAKHPYTQNKINEYIYAYIIRSLEKRRRREEKKKRKGKKKKPSKGHKMP